MRLLYINNTLIDIDDNTSIGIDIQTYDIKEPAKRKINISNSFTIPITNNNLKAIGYIGGFQNNETDIYGTLLVDYYVNNTQFIKQGKLRIESIQNRIECYVFEKPDIWDELKKVNWSDFLNEYYNYLVSVKGLPHIFSGYTGTWDEFITPYTQLGGQYGLFIPITLSTAQDFETNNKSVSEIDSLGFSQSGSAFCTFIKNIFEFIEYKYNVDFNTTGTFTGNIFNDEIGGSMYIPIRDIYPVYITDFFFVVNTSNEPVDYQTNFEASETRDKTLYDLVIAFFHKLNVFPVVDLDGNYKLYRFDDIDNLGNVVNFSGNIDGVPKFKPYISNYFQNNYIKVKDVETGINALTNARNLTCNNINIEVTKDIIEINEYIGLVTDNTVWKELVPDISTVDSFKNFKFFVNGEIDTVGCDIEIFHQTAPGFYSTNIVGMYYASYYSLDNEYTLIDEALNYPKYYEIQKWMNSLDVLNFDFFKAYYIQELGGSFFVNKIKGFNPDKSKQATTLELIKISDKTPDSEYITDIAYEDGVGNFFTDGMGNYYV